MRLKSYFVVYSKVYTEEGLLEVFVTGDRCVEFGGGSKGDKIFDQHRGNKDRTTTLSERDRKLPRETSLTSADRRRRTGSESVDLCFPFFCATFVVETHKNPGLFGKRRED